MSNDYCEEHGQPFPCNECQRLWAFAAKPHVCPPLSAALREKVEAELRQAGNAIGEWGKALRWLLREADALAEREQSK